VSTVTQPASVRGEILVAGEAGTGPALVLSAPLSFWGGVDPKTGAIADVRHPQHGGTIAGRVLFLPGTIGSSSASAVLMELVHNGHAPAALVLHEPDAILLLGLIVAKEMGWKTPVAVRLDKSRFAGFTGAAVSVSADGLLRLRAG
jgi:predicted aconitase with swiveling domain